MTTAHFSDKRLISRLLISVAVLLFSGESGLAQQQQSWSPTDNGKTAAFILSAASDIGEVNLYNGRVSLRIPLGTVGGRGRASYEPTVSISRAFVFRRVQDFFQSSGQWSPPRYRVISEAYQDSLDFSNIQPGLLPAVLLGRKTRDTNPGTSENTPCSAVTKIYVRFAGGEVELRDVLTNGEPFFDFGFNPLNRGKQWHSVEGSDIFFQSDFDILDEGCGDRGFQAMNGGNVFNPTGYLMMKDGTRYRFVDGQPRWMRDRNGNTLVFGPTGTVTDSINREYQLQGGLTYKDTNGINQTMAIITGNLDTALRADLVAAGVHARTEQELFPSISALLVGATNLFNPVVTKAIRLPNGLEYRFFYNEYGELARIEMPLGGIIEYDYVPIGSGIFPSETPQVNRVVTEKRVYNIAGQLHSRQTFTFAPDTGITVTTVKNYDAANNLVANERHTLKGNVGADFQFTGWYQPFDNGRELTVEILDGATPANVLRRTDNTWNTLDEFGNPTTPPVNTATHRTNVDCALTEAKTTLSDTNQVSKRTFSYDAYGNQTDIYEYDFGAVGSGVAGSFVRRTHTGFVNDAAYTQATGPYILVLPAEQWVSSDLNGTNKVSRLTYEYDNYSLDSLHAPLVDRSNISGLCLKLDDNGVNCIQPSENSGTLYVLRGNLTQTTAFSNIAAGLFIKTAVQFDIAGNAVKTVDGRGTPTTIEYSDCFGTPDSDARVNSAPAQLNGKSAFAFPTSSTKAGLTSFLQFNYHRGVAVNSEDANGSVSSFEYGHGVAGGVDPLDRPNKTVNAVNDSSIKSQISYFYDDAARTLTTTRDLDAFDDNQLKLVVVYDGLARIVETREFEGTTNYIATQTQYDSLSRVSKVSNPYRPLPPNSETPSWTANEYDFLGRIKSVTTPDNGVVNMFYDGTRALMRDQAGKERLSLTNALGQLKEVWEITPVDGATQPVTFPNRPEVTAGYLTKYDYDVLDSLLIVTQRVGATGAIQTRTFSYDALKRLESAGNPESGTVSYKYDENGNVRVKTDARNVSAHFKYDQLNRLTKRWYNSSSAVEDEPANENLPANVALSPQANYVYDAHPATSPFFSFQSQDKSKGHLTAVTYGSGSTEGDYYRYDSRGRNFAKIQRIGTKDYLVSAQYNRANDIKLMTYPSTRTVTNIFDTAGRLSSMSGTLGDNANRTYSTNILYTPDGALAKEQFGTLIPIYNKHFYNSRQQLAEILASTTDGSSWNRGKILNQYSLQCSGAGCNATDNNGNLRKQEVFIPANEQVSSFTSWSQQYDYDELNRLKRVHEYTGNINLDWQQEFDYDRWGNRTINGAGTFSAPAAPGTIPEPNYGVNTTLNNNRLTAPTGFTISYDNAGNLTSDTYNGAGTRIFDAENRMTQWGDPTGQFNYDAEGRRVRRKVGGVETWQVYGIRDELLAEYPFEGAQGNPAKEYGYRNGQMLISADAGSGFAVPEFADDFNDNSLNLTSWTVWYPSPPTVSEQSQQLQIILPPNTAGYNGVYSNSTYNLTNKMVQVEAPQAVSQAGWCENFLLLELDANNYFMIQVGAGNMIFRSRVNGVNDQTSIAFDAAANRFWRIRHDQSTNLIYFETSADDSVWLTRKTVTPGFSLAALRFELMAGAYGTGNSSPGTAKYDNFKLLASSAGSVSLTVPNSGFEAPVLGNGNFQYSPSGGSWSFAGGGGITGQNSGFTGTASAAPEGVQVAFIQANGTVSQSISGFQASSNYVITFSAIQRTNCCNTGGQDIGVYIDDVLVGSFHPSAVGYGEYSTTAFTTSTGPHTIKFAGLNPLGGDHTAFIDKVRITGTPKPGFGVQWLLSDHLGTPRMVFDESGELASVKRHDYLPYGEPLATGTGLRSPGQGYASADGLRQKFTAYERDETGLDYTRARFFSATMGRFASADIPLVDQYKPEPQSWNLYSYVGNKPLTYTDPLGLWKRIKCEGGTCWRADKNDSFESLAKKLHVSPKKLAAHFQHQPVTEGLIVDVSFFFANTEPPPTAPPVTRVYFEVIAWKPVIPPPFQSMAGHLSFRIGDMSWSREKWGWDIRPFEDYLKENTWRDGVGYVLDDPNDPSWAAKFAELVVNFHGPWTPQQNCGEPFCRAPRQMGLPDNNSLTPIEHRAYILTRLRPYIREIIYYDKGVRKKPGEK